jgi:hypothetical protein
MINYIFIVSLLVNSVTFVANAHSENNLLIDKLATEKLPKDLRKLNFKEVGSAKFSVLFWDIYDSTLYTKSGTYLHEHSADSLIFEIEYLKDITSNDLVDRTVQQWKYLEIAESEYSKFIPILKTIWPDITSGDKLAMLVVNKLSLFYFNEVKIGQIKEKEFSKLFLDIWLSPKTSQTKLRTQLLGGTK